MRPEDAAAEPIEPPSWPSAIGIRKPLEQTVYDLAVVGAGPAGLAAAVYGASEGLVHGRGGMHSARRAGGQQHADRELPRLPHRHHRRELADRAVLQANKFGAVLSVSAAVIGLSFENAYALLHLDGSESVVAKCLLITTGAEYRRLGVEGCDQYEGCGVFYAATPNEAQMCRGTDVVVVGGGNSAGQAAVFLAGQARRVLVLIRGDDLYKSMSSYLARRIEETENIDVLRNTEVRRMSGNGQLRAVEIVNTKTGETSTLETPALFSFIGAVPRTEWLPQEIETDSRGFIRTGPALAQSPRWTRPRQPFLLETSRPGVFAAGDVRSGSVKRVASAVGEGAMAVQFIHEYLKEM